MNKTAAKAVKSATKMVYRVDQNMFMLQNIKNFYIIIFFIVV